MLALALVDYGQMALYIGSEPFLQRTIATQFFQLAPGRIAEAALLAEKRDFAGLRVFCHAMEAGAATMGAHLVAKICRRLANAATSHDIAAVQELTESFSQALRQYCVDLCREFELEEA
jgi:HPt (histidine-containing phosphotransfer) domain-containing protein